MTLVHLTTWTRRGLLAALWVGALLGLLVFRAHRAGEAAMVQSDKSFDRGELAASLSSARDAAGWYFSAAPHVERAYDRMLAIALGAERSGDSKMAVRAYATMRGVIYETSHAWSNRQLLLERANSGMIRLLPRDRELDAQALEGLARDYAAMPGPKPVFKLATSAAVLLLVLAGWLIIARRELRYLSLGVLTAGCGLFLWVFAALGA